MERETSRIIAYGHPNILAAHRTTIELTREDFLNKTGDCIIGVRADKSLADLDNGFKEFLKQGKRIRISLECNGVTDKIIARGDPRLTFKDKTSMVIRKSDYVCGRTLCVRADKAAKDLDRRLVEELKKGGELHVDLEIL